MRPKEEVMPPKSSVKAEWVLQDFGDVTPGVGHPAREQTGS